MEHDDFIGGYENGNDWLIDLAIDDYFLNKERERNERERKTLQLDCDWVIDRSIDL